MRKFLEISQIAKSFPKERGDARIVKDFSLSLREGEFVSLIGHSGCGKSTLRSIDEPLSMLDSNTHVELRNVRAELCAATHKTTLMVSHDVDESLFLSDRVAMMTSGRDATLDAVLDVPYTRPRDRRRSVIEGEAFEGLRCEVLGLLEAQAHPKASPLSRSALPMTGFIDATKPPAS